MSKRSTLFYHGQNCDCCDCENARIAIEEFVRELVYARSPSAVPAPATLSDKETT